MAESLETAKNLVRNSMKEYPDVAHVVTIYNCNDQHVCDVCRRLEGRHYNEDIFRLPNPEDVCTCEFGCRCLVSWTTDITYKMPKKKKIHPKGPWWKRRKS